jgi:hypothetical protein
MSDFDLAARDAQEAEAEAERADDAMTRGYVYGWAATFGAMRRNVPLTGLSARHLLKLVADTGLRTWAPAAEQFDRWSRSMSGGEPFSVDNLRAPRPALKEVGHDKIVTPIIGVLAAEAEVRYGRAGEALALAEDLIRRCSCERPSLAGGRVAKARRGQYKQHTGQLQTLRRR